MGILKSMSPLATCNHSRPALPPDTGGQCPACFLQLGLDAGLGAGCRLQPGDCVGRYELLEWIGEGGCGVVFMAGQLEPVCRKVALKVIKPGMDTRQVIARFEAERQTLALLDHPNIAKIFDAGATFHAALENLSLKTPSDVRPFEDTITAALLLERVPLRGRYEKTEGALCERSDSFVTALLASPNGGSAVTRIT